MNNKRPPFLKLTWRLLLLLIFPLMVWLKIPLEKVISLETLWWMELMAILGFVFAAWNIVRISGQWVVKMVPILSAMLAVWGQATDIPQRLFLGEKIADVRWADVPTCGSIELFEAGECRLGSGGVFGESSVQYGQWRVEDGDILVEGIAEVQELSGQYVDIQGVERMITFAIPDEEFVR